jgi:hypothetical protein
MAIIIAYCNGEDRVMRKRKAGIQTLAGDLDWTIYEGILQNTNAGGYVEANTQYCVLAHEDLTEAWRESPAIDDDKPEAMESILDVNDGIFEDCHRYQAKVWNKMKQTGSNYFAQIKG